MGKNFSCNNLGQRRSADLYETPYSLTQQFLLLEMPDNRRRYWVPGCGNGAILKILRAQGLKADGDDLAQGYNFLSDGQERQAIITNPPYSLALEFILHAKQVCPWFAFLLPLAYLHGKERYDRLYTDRAYPLESVSVFTRYPMLGQPLREDGCYRTGMMVYAWYVWNQDAALLSPPAIRWIDNHAFVLGSR